jgi:hypothetical protein
MKRYQIPIIIGLFAAALLCVAPPQWVAYSDTSEKWINVHGHHWIWSPPKEEDSESVRSGWTCGMLWTQFRLELAAIVLTSSGAALLVGVIDRYRASAQQ